MRRLRRQEGLSLVEVTIMLLVLMLLTSVLAPSIFDFVNDAQWVKVKEDCEALAISVARLHKDVGAKLNAMLEMGRSRPWPEALEAFAGSPDMSGKAVVAYFAPLQAWLEEQNKGQQCGW